MDKTICGKNTKAMTFANSFKTILSCTREKKTSVKLDKSFQFIGEN